MAKRVVFFNRFYWPDESATSQILTDLAPFLAEQGWDVEVVTSRLLYADPAARLQKGENAKGVRIHRLWSTGFGRGKLGGRLLDYLTIYLSFAWFLLMKTRKGQIVVMKTDPPLLSVLGWFFKWIRGYKLVSWCQDVFPEVAMVGLNPNPVVKTLFNLLRALRNRSLNRSEMIAVLSDDMQQHLSRDCPEGQFRKLPNWAIHSRRAASEEVERLREEWGLRDRFVVGYSGNLGRVHDWKTVRDAMPMLKDLTNLTFLFIGGGAGYVQLQSELGEVSQPQVLFLPYQPREVLPVSLAVPDVHWLSLQSGMTPFVFPSKYYGIIETGRSVIFIGESSSELARKCLARGGDSAVPEGDAEAFAHAVRAAYSAKEACSQGPAANSRQAAFSEWMAALDTLV
jgi:glycosyltransferase involved in cell wall biosynthesis